MVLNVPLCEASSQNVPVSLPTSQTGTGTGTQQLSNIYAFVFVTTLLFHIQGAFYGFEMDADAFPHSKMKVARGVFEH